MVTGGCDDSSGDPRLARGLPFGSMSVVRLPHPMPEGFVMREEVAMARPARRPGARHPHKRRASRGRSAPFEQMHLHAAGMDGGATEPGVAVPEDRAEEPGQRFGAFTADLYAMAEWLQQCQIETVVLESTGVYWLALFAGLEERGFDVRLVDAHDARQVPGRETDMKDCQWLQELHT